MYYLCVSACDSEDGVPWLRDQLLYLVTNRSDNLVTNLISVHCGYDNGHWQRLVVIDRHSYTPISQVYYNSRISLMGIRYSGTYSTYSSTGSTYIQDIKISQCWMRMRQLCKRVNHTCIEYCIIYYRDTIVWWAYEGRW